MRTPAHSKKCSAKRQQADGCQPNGMSAQNMTMGMSARKGGSSERRHCTFRRQEYTRTGGARPRCIFSSVGPTDSLLWRRRCLE